MNKSYSAIQVAVIGNFKDLPTISKKDALDAVAKSLGNKEIELKEGPQKVEPPSNNKNQMILNLNKNESNRSDIINRLKRIQALKNKSEKNNSSSPIGQGNTSDKGSPTGLSGIEGTTLAQSTDQGIQNWYLQKAQRKIHANFQINPGFASNSPNLKTNVLVKIKQDGSITHIEISKSSGNTIYDDLVLGFVRQSAPFGNVPDEFQKMFSEDGVEFHFVRSELE